MKSIINGKLYDTDTAVLVGEWWNGYGINNFRYVDEKLFKKDTGEYFLYGSGGAMSVYSEQRGDHKVEGEKILPFNLADAKIWAEEHLDADKYIAEFGNPEDGEPGDGKQTLYVSITNAARSKLEQMSSLSGKTFSELFDELILNA